MEIKDPSEFQSSNFDEGYTQQDIPSTINTKIYIEAVNK